MKSLYLLLLFLPIVLYARTSQESSLTKWIVKSTPEDDSDYDDDDDEMDSSLLADSVSRETVRMLASNKVASPKDGIRKAETAIVECKKPDVCLPPAVSKKVEKKKEVVKKMPECKKKTESSCPLNKPVPVVSVEDDGEGEEVFSEPKIDCSPDPLPDCFSNLKFHNICPMRPEDFVPMFICCNDTQAARAKNGQRYSKTFLGSQKFCKVNRGLVDNLFKKLHKNISEQVCKYKTLYEQYQKHLQLRDKKSDFECNVVSDESAMGIDLLDRANTEEILDSFARNNSYMNDTCDPVGITFPPTIRGVVFFEIPIIS